MELFERRWTSYRAVVEHDLMEHRGLAQATAAALQQWLDQRGENAERPTMLDLGCGDLALLATALRRLPLRRYVGLDLSADVLPLAQQALGEAPFSSHWQQGDLLAWAEASSHGEAWLEQPDILHSAFAIHHLSDPQKERFLKGARQQIAPGGVFLWADVFRAADEPLDAYLQRYQRRIEQGWEPLSTGAKAHVLEHMHQYDRPADRSVIQAIAEAAGWRWRWIWQGSHQAEALAVLHPA
jgi:SAM-dependent methyltransferase